MVIDIDIHFVSKMASMKRSGMGELKVFLIKNPS
jgi:hypothetical protein